MVKELKKLMCTEIDYSLQSAQGKTGVMCQQKGRLMNWFRVV